MSARHTSIEAFDLYIDGDGSRHYERDHDLFINAKSATDGGETAALVLIELGIDGNRTHRAKFDFGLAEPSPDGFTYERDVEVRALSDAIETPTALRDRMAAMLDA